MKRILTFLTCLVLVFSLAGCSSTKREVTAQLQGDWRAEQEDLTISGKHVETMGYYELDGQRLAGVGEVGKLTVKNDGTIIINMGGQEREGYLEDETTLVLDGEEYYR